MIYPQFGISIIRKFIERGVDLYCLNNDNKTPLELLCSESNYHKITSILSLINDIPKKYVKKYVNCIDNRNDIDNDNKESIKKQLRNKQMKT